MPPLCKGRWCEAPEGLLQKQGTTPQACSTPAPLAQGSRKAVQLTPCTGEPKHAPTKIAQIYQCLLLTGEVAASAAGGRDNERAKTAHKCCCTVSLYQSPFGDSFLVRGSLCYIGKDVSCPLQNKNPDGICRRGAKLWFARFHPRVSLWMRVDLCAASHREGVVPAPACRGILQPRIPSLTAVYARTCLVPLWPL